MEQEGNSITIIDRKVRRGPEISHLTFSWRLAGADRGIRQTAWSIRVAETLEGLVDGRYVWDSGLTTGSLGSKSIARYAGPPLKSNTRYWWSVEIRDESGRPSASEPDSFDTALAPQDWVAEWIWKPGPVRINDFAYFRKTFETPVPLNRARVFVSAHHYVQLFVNGTRVGGYGSPAPTLPTHRKLYLTYDITGLLREGLNAFGAIVHYLGGSGQNTVDGTPAFLLQAQFDATDGTSQTIRTDETWEVLKDIPHSIGTPYQQSRRISAIEQYDGGVADDGWCKPEGGRQADTERAVPVDRNGEVWPLVPQELPEGAVEETIVPVPVGIQQPGRQVFDAGKIVSGWPRLKAIGKEGATVRMRYSESLDDEGCVTHNVCNETSETYYDEYRMAGRGTETWEPILSYKAFRYVEVTGYPELLGGENIRIVSAHTALTYTGSFRSSNELLNEIYTACIQTQKNNVLGQLVDCPHREQAQYLADSDLQAETLLYGFDALPALDKLLSDFTGAQREDGTFPFVFPSNNEHPDFAIEIPEWDLHFITVLWKMYRFSGDLAYVQQHYAAAKRLMDGVVARIDETGLVPKGEGWHISDWPYPTIDQEGTYLTAQNLKSYHNLGLMAAMAELLELSSDEAAYSACHASLGAAIRKHLYDDERGLFIDCSGSEQRHQGINVLALEYGLVPEEKRTAVLDYIVAEGHRCKTLLSLNLLRVLFENGREADAYRLLNHTQYPGWGYMIAQGSKTIWEGFDDIESHCHAWNAYPARLFVEYLVGIRHGAPGFASVELRPWLPEGMRFAEGSVMTSAGRIRVRWERTGDQGIAIEADVPPNTTAMLVLPAEPARIKRVLESGREVSGVEEEGRVSFSIGSGSYQFAVVLK